MSTRVPISKIHLKRNSYQSSYDPQKFSSSRLLKTDRSDKCHDSRTSFKGLEDSKYQSSIMKRMITQNKQEQLLRTPTQTNSSNVPDLEFRNYLTPIGKALTERKQSDFEERKHFQIGNFHKKKSTDRSNHQAQKKVIDERRTSSNLYTTQNNCYQLDNQYAIRKYEQSESILTEKNKRINDLQRLNKFFLKRAEELSDTSDQLNKKNLYLKSQLKHFEGVMERMLRLEKKCDELEKRDQTDSVNYQTEKQQILNLTKMC